MINTPTISASIIELKNIPLEAIDLMVRGWEECGRYVKTGKAKHTNPTARALDTWIILKTITTSGKIHNYRQQLNDLAATCKIGVRMLQSRIKWLKERNLVYTENKHLYLNSYKSLKQEFEIDITERTQQVIFYDTTDNITLAEKLFPLGIDRMKERCRYMYNKKINKNTTTRREISNHAVAYGANQEKLGNTEYFRHSHLVLQLKTYKEEPAGQTSFYLTHDHVDANPDLNFKQATLARRMGYAVLEKTDPVTGKDISESIGVGHFLRRLAKKNLITIKKGHVESEYRARKDEAVFHHRFVRETKKTIWYRPNQITVNHEAIFVQKRMA